MASVTFITGNEGKAKFLAQHLGVDVAHKKLELDEIQSLDLHEITEHKVKQAYTVLKTPVLVEDVALSIEKLNGLPGPFIKWFEKTLGLDGICQIAAGSKAVAIVCFAYYDGERLKFFEGSLSGRIADSPAGSNGFGFDPILIPDGQEKRLAEMTDEELPKYALRTTTVYPQIKLFLKGLLKS